MIILVKDMPSLKDGTHCFNMIKFNSISLYLQSICYSPSASRVLQRTSGKQRLRQVTNVFKNIFLLLFFFILNNLKCSFKKGVLDGLNLWKYVHGAKPQHHYHITDLALCGGQ